VDHVLGPHNLVELGVGDVAAADGFLAQGGAVLVARLGDLGGVVVADLGARAVTSISERSRPALMLSSRGSMPTTQLSVKLIAASASRRTDCRKL
jgi:hypothetical protein